MPKKQVRRQSRARTKCWCMKCTNGCAKATNGCARMPGVSQRLNIAALFLSHVGHAAIRRGAPGFLMFLASCKHWSPRMSLSLWPGIYLFAWHLTVRDRWLMPYVYAQHAKPASRTPRSGLRGMGQCPIPSHIWGWYRTGNTVPTGAGQSRRQLQPVRCPALRSMMGMGPM